MKPFIIFLVALLSVAGNRANAQPIRLTIREAYRLAREHYPSSRRRDLIALTKQYTVENAARGYLPQLSFSGQATEQSAVTIIPIKVPAFSLAVLLEAVTTARQVPADGPPPGS